MTLLRDVEDFLDRTLISPSAFGDHVASNSSLMNRWRSGQIRIGPQREARIRAYLAENSTPEKIAELRAKSGKRLNLHAPNTNDPDNWPSRATKASAKLLAAIRQHHPERCGA
ncbi:hypothetical protein [Sphingobium aromaticiconvertens]|uniref:hypothetical protein n=1 Tax=Sphingobium aromaticiconvertens TaxID=365341 RepID=UPI00301750FF